MRESGVLGIHLEGPFLSPERPGVHDPGISASRRREDVALLTAPRRGVMLVTLAPEQVPPGFIAQLAAAGVRVSLGHSMATYAETRAAMAEGLTGFTHLFNAMRPLASREPGPIAAALESPDAWFGMIVDGVHVDPAMLRLGVARRRPSHARHRRHAAGRRQPARAFSLYGETIDVADGRCSACRRHARRLGARHGDRGTQLRPPARRFARIRLAGCRDTPGQPRGARSLVGPTCPRLSRGCRGDRPEQRRSAGNLDGRMGKRSSVVASARSGTVSKI